MQSSDFWPYNRDLLKRGSCNSPTIQTRVRAQALGTLWKGLCLYHLEALLPGICAESNDMVIVYDCLLSKDFTTQWQSTLG
eukprot:scaffold62756_cov14-Tisochrysis_lutea.AAC.1